MVVTQTYNAAGWVLSTTDGLNHTTTNSYDDLGRLLSTTNPEENTTQYEYDAAGNVTRVTEADGTIKIYWGGADTVMCVGEADVADLVALCLQDSKAHAGPTD